MPRRGAKIAQVRAAFALQVELPANDRLAQFVIADRGPCRRGLAGGMRLDLAGCRHPSC